jgi:hypothetical protein
MRLITKLFGAGMLILIYNSRYNCKLIDNYHKEKPKTMNKSLSTLFTCMHFK